VIDRTVFPAGVVAPQRGVTPPAAGHAPVLGPPGHVPGPGPAPPAPAAQGLPPPEDHRHAGSVPGVTFDL